MPGDTSEAVKALPKEQAGTETVAHEAVRRIGTDEWPRYRDERGGHDGRSAKGPG